MNGIYRDLYVSRKEPLVIEMAQGTNAVPLIFGVKDWDVPAAGVATLYIEKPSGALIYDSATISGNQITVNMTTQMTAEVGINKCQIMVVQNTSVMFSFVFLLKVAPTIVDDEAIESQDEFTALEEALAAVSDVVTHSELASKGSATNGVYFNSSGVATPMTYTLGKSVPSDASFSNVSTTTKGYVPAPTASNTYKAFLTDGNGSPAWRTFPRYVTGSWTYQEGQTRLSVLQKAVNDGVIPTSGPPFIGYISAGAGYFMTGFFYATGSSFSGFAMVGTYNGISFIGVASGVYSELN